MSIFSNFFRGKRKTGAPSPAKADPVTPNDGQCIVEPIHTEVDNSDPGVAKIYHLIVLDESGSMYCITRQTISGCNETIQTIRQMQKANPDQRHYVSIYLFSSGRSHYIIKYKKVDDVREIGNRDYVPGSSTPLFDALGFTLTEMKSVVKPSETLGYVTIITDGYENDSHEYDLEKVRKLIDELKGMNVIFSFIGANIDAASYAQDLHINNSMQFEQTQEGAQEMWKQERECKLRSSSRFSFMRRYESKACMDFGARENEGNYYKSKVSESRITPDRVSRLGENEIFVFGSNAQGRHEGGAAALAVDKFGAIMGQAEGLQGRSYAIPTAGVSEQEMYQSICRFSEFAEAHPELIFYVTAVGCGSAGYTPYVVAPMFSQAARLDNVKLPKDFWLFNDTVGL